MQTKLFIDNEFRPARSGKTFIVENPATETPLAEVALAGVDDIDDAVGAAKRCFESAAWQGLSARERGKKLVAVAERLEERAEELAALETRQNGKNIGESMIEVRQTAELFRYAAGWTDKLAGDTLPFDHKHFVYTLREPLGVVGAIVPWNFPLNIAGWKVAPALAAGCTVVLKPALEAPLTALLLGEIAAEAGLPAGALNVVVGDGPRAGEALATHPLIDKLTFTGSTSTGRRVMALAAENNTPVSLELGGKSPNIIFDDAPLGRAMRGAQNAVFYGKGEVCAAGSRLLVDASVYDEVIDKLVAGAKRRKPGDPLSKRCLMGALVSAKQKQRVLSLIDRGCSEGATLVVGGKATDFQGKGHYVEATVFADVSPEMTIFKEEIFGPVLAVTRFSGEAEAIALANDSRYGLAAGIWTSNLGRAHRVASALRAGMVWINCYNLFDPAIPFGGFKASGFGKDLGRESIDGYLRTKTIWLSLV
jgi:aldehyde dehydrogenase (NAD+)